MLFTHPFLLFASSTFCFYSQNAFFSHLYTPYLPFFYTETSFCNVVICFQRNNTYTIIYIILYFVSLFLPSYHLLHILNSNLFSFSLSLFQLYNLLYNLLYKYNFQFFNILLTLVSVKDNFVKETCQKKPEQIFPSINIALYVTRFRLASF